MANNGRLNVRGRRRGEVRLAVADLLHAGLCGTVDALAARTGWPPEHVRVAIQTMRRGGEVVRVGSAAAQAARGAPACVYAVRTDGVGYLCEVMRGFGGV